MVLSLEQKVQLLLDDSFAPVSTPDVPPLVVHSRRVGLSKSKEQALLARLCARRKTETPSSFVDHRPPPLNTRSAELARGLEPIYSRYPKLLAAQHRRRAQLVEAKEKKEQTENVFRPTLCETSRIIVEKSDPESRILLADKKFQKIVREAESREYCSFTPRVNTTHSSTISVVDRMMIDSQKRQQKRQERNRQKELEILASCGPPKINSARKYVPAVKLPETPPEITSFIDFTKQHRNYHGSVKDATVPQQSDDWERQPEWQRHSELIEHVLRPARLPQYSPYGDIFSFTKT